MLGPSHGRGHLSLVVNTSSCLGKRQVRAWVLQLVRLGFLLTASTLTDYRTLIVPQPLNSSLTCQVEVGCSSG